MYKTDLFLTDLPRHLVDHLCSGAGLRFRSEISWHFVEHVGRISFILEFRVFRNIYALQFRRIFMESLLL